MILRCPRRPPSRPRKCQRCVLSGHFHRKFLLRSGLFCDSRNGRSSYAAFVVLLEALGITYYVAVFSHDLVVMGRLWCFALEAIHRIGRTVTFPDGQAVLDGRGDEIFGGSHAFSDRLLMRQVSCDG